MARQGGECDRAGSGTQPWSGHFLWQPGLLSYVGPGGSSDRHSHHALQLAISFDEPLELLLDDRQVRARAVLVASRVPHAFRTDGRRIFYALIEPHSTIGSSLMRRTAQSSERDLVDILPIGDAPAAEADALIDYTQRMFDVLAPQPPAAPLSEPVISALAYLDAALDHSPRLTQAARAAHISPSRLTHLFSEQVGIPFRRFVLWLRLRRAAEHVWQTRSLTEAAHAAGFSDLAHFSRVCRATFGVAPTGLLGMAPVSASWPDHVRGLPGPVVPPGHRAIG
ncbi:MAG TPA: helix-turn-helix transcriptional regulator [Solirubrobacteraceae bacterium]|jgi:AraC-like DNA-binding protein